MKSRSVSTALRTAVFSLVALTSVSLSHAADLPSYDEETVARYRSLASEGYAALEKGDFATAIAKLTEQSELIAGAAGGYYNLACAQSLAGNVAEGLAALQQSVNNGWDRMNYILEDPDLNALRDDPAYAAIIEKTKANIAAGEAVLGMGLANYDTAPHTFADEDELEEWVERNDSRISTNSRIWNTWMTTAARLDAQAQKLAALRELKRDDPSFDYGLERIRVYSDARTIWDCWGTLGDAAVAEAEAYLAGSPSAAGAAEARYVAGYASAQSVCDPESPQMAAAAKKARDYFAQVGEGSELYGAAQAWLAYYELETAKDNPEKTYPLIKKVAAEYGAEERTAEVMGVKFPDEVVKAIWPIDIKLTDIDGELVTLEQYKGKVLLIDFWATWCGPCRRELPNVKNVYKKYHDKGLEILSVSLDRGEKVSQEAYRTWITDAGMNWRHIYDEKYWDAELAGRFFVKAIPAAFLIGRDGSLLALGDDCYGEKLEEAVARSIAAN